MKNSKSLFRNLEKRLLHSSWFADGWNIYNRGEYLQLYKDGWYNHNQGGIHFETYIESREIRQKEFPICVHAESDCPSQEIFIKELLIQCVKVQRGVRIGHKNIDLYHKLGVTLQG